jgi:hypothetical protein
MDTEDKNRKSVVKGIIRTLRQAKKRISPKQINTKRNNERIEECEVTGLQFVGTHFAGNNTAVSENFVVWIGLWLDAPIVVDINNEEFLCFPRWLAEAIMEETELKISESCIYDDPKEKAYIAQLRNVVADNYSVYFEWNKHLFKIFESKEEAVLARRIGEISHYYYGMEVRLIDSDKLEYFHPETEVLVTGTYFKLQQF